MADSITTITHSKSGASCRVHPFGATIISFKSADGRENLFCSSDALLDGSKPIRGGIPIVFPVFGPTKTTMPQHGFARRNVWKVESTFDKEEAAGATLSLSLADVKEGRGDASLHDNPWDKEQAEKDETDCKLVYEIRVEAKELTTTLIIKNTGKSSFDFQALLHTYLAVDGRAALEKASVTGLGGYAITDKVSGDSGHVQSYDDPVVLSKDVDTDRVYIHPDDHPVVHAKVSVGADDKTVRIEAAGQVSEEVAPVSCVVWNPGPTKAADMADFANDEYQDMICVEPGLIGHQALLQPGSEARLTQSIIV